MQRASIFWKSLIQVRPSSFERSAAHEKPSARMRVNT
jgi:hypothetical protein